MSVSAAAISKNHDALAKLISSWAESNPPVEAEEAQGEEGIVTIALRTRPFLKNEGEGLLSGVHARGRKMWVHVPSSKWSGPTVQHKAFEGDFAFGPESTSEEVYERLVVRPGVLDTVLGGGIGCILAYGQTGSGKTHTISSLEEIISRNVFQAAESYASTHFPNSTTTPQDTFTIGISMYELLGNKAIDLLDRDGPGVDIAEDKFGGIQVSAKVVSVTDAKQLAEMIATAASHRRTSATLKNETSSRSHCVLNIIVTNTLVPSVEAGRLVLVDLAGSERAADRTAHTKELMDEARLINTSLMSLKDCVRGRALVEAERSKLGDGKVGFQHIPYRNSKLTLALKPVFDVEATRHSRTVIIAHVSPHLVDASHSNNTLTYVSPFRVTTTSQSTTSSEASPAAWSNEDFRAWVAQASSKIDPPKLAPFESGKQMCELEEGVFIQRCLDSQKDGLGKPLTETGAKAFYDKLWGLIGEAEFILTLTSSNKHGETVSIEDVKGLHTKLWKIENDTWNASRTETLAQRDPNGGTGAYDTFDEERLNDPALYALVYGTQPPLLEVSGE